MTEASFQYMSDLHLEMRPGLRINPNDVRAPYLILAGDIGDPGTHEYVNFLTHAAKLYESVFVVLGNHECYGRRMDKAKRLADVACSRAGTGNDDNHVDNVFLLNRNRPFAIAKCKNGNDFIRVLGCTLWSHVPSEAAPEVRSGLSDYRAIQGFGIQTGNNEHESDATWLKNQLLEARSCNVKCIVVTHHAPLMNGTSHPMYESDPDRSLRHAFATDMSSLLKEFADVAPVWIHGHTHHTHKSVLKCDDGSCVTVASNQRGYNAKEGIDFRTDVDPITVSNVAQK
jgi:predicted phosphodiesterase